MKRRDILKKLLAAGLTAEEGGSHTKIFRDGRKVSVVSRQREIDEYVVRQIERQTGVKLR